MARESLSHGGLSYDDPIEVTLPGTDPGTLQRLYPLFDEAGALGSRLS